MRYYSDINIKKLTAKDKVKIEEEAQKQKRLEMVASSVPYHSKISNMKANIFKERSMDTEDSHGLTEALITESSSKTTFKEKEYITGLTRENMMALG